MITTSTNEAHGSYVANQWSTKGLWCRRAPPGQFSVNTAIDIGENTHWREYLPNQTSKIGWYAHSTGNLRGQELPEQGDRLRTTFNAFRSGRGEYGGKFRSRLDVGLCPRTATPRLPPPRLKKKLVTSVSTGCPHWFIRPERSTITSLPMGAITSRITMGRPPSVGVQCASQNWGPREEVLRPQTTRATHSRVLGSVSRATSHTSQSCASGGPEGDSGGLKQLTDHTENILQGPECRGVQSTNLKALQHSVSRVEQKLKALQSKPIPIELIPIQQSSDRCENKLKALQAKATRNETKQTECHG